MHVTAVMDEHWRRDGHGTGHGPISTQVLEVVDSRGGSTLRAFDVPYWSRTRTYAEYSKAKNPTLRKMPIVIDSESNDSKLAASKTTYIINTVTRTEATSQSAVIYKEGGI